MAGIADFRGFPFARSRVDACGTYLGHRAYWKLYAIENYLRVLLHSVLFDQIGASWFDSVVEQGRRKEIEKLKTKSLANKAHTLPGRHSIYYLYLSDLSKVMLTANHLIAKVVPEVNLWIVKIEEVRVPRNLVGHMNFPNERDRGRIDTLHSELTGLVQSLESKPGFKLRVP